MPKSMTSRERVNAAMQRRDHDRIPRNDGPWPETYERWKQEGMQNDEAFERVLRRDFSGLCWTWPVPFPGRHEVLEETDETQLVRGSMGKIERSWKDKSGTPEHVDFDCDSRDKWEIVYKPALLATDPHVSPTDAGKALGAARALEHWTHYSGIESFEAMRQLVGDVVLMTAMADDPEWVRDMSSTYTDLILRDFDALMEADVAPDGVWVFGDIGYRNGPFFSPRMYDELILPDHRRIGDWAHARGLKYIYHTDGDVRSLIPGLLNAGADCIQPMEAKAGMDVRELAPMYGDRLTFFGNIDMTVACTNDKALVEEEVCSKLEAGMANKGYIYHSDHSVPPGVSWETYQFIIELLDRHGVYV
ncbi:MAG: hypothetical protein O2923_02790 [Verrucomicrobia bacterium]|nr:hypothetical protein [Verrucomicrobiota bacterium]MDA1086570.1 hypothetical protein [Verrucomicrobiota bacterium]